MWSCPVWWWFLWWGGILLSRRGCVDVVCLLCDLDGGMFFLCVVLFCVVSVCTGVL